MIGLLGAGKMGMAIINGALSAGIYSKKDLVVYDAFDEKAKELKQDGFNVMLNELEVFEQCDTLILALKPQTFPEVLEKLKLAKKKPHLVVTIAAGITLDYLRRELGDLNFIRVMPSTPALIKKGVSCIARGKGVNDEDFASVKKVFESIGIAIEVEEDMINEYMPMNGSFPAFFYYFIRSFVRSAENRGMDAEIAKRLATESAISSAMMILNSDRSIDQLIKDVCSPKGTTLEGLTAFDEHNMDKVVDECVVRCINRGKELEK